MGVMNITERALVVASEFAKGSQFYPGPAVPSRIEGAKRVYSCGGVEYSVSATASYGMFLLEHLRTTLGKGWLREQRSLTAARAHPVALLFESAEEYAKVVRPKLHASGVEHAILSCAQRELFTLADDLATLAMISAVPADMAKRLRGKDLYQGARYEVAIAAGFARSGFQIKWLPSNVPSPEFIASHPVTGDSVVVETKSRHRSNGYPQFVGRARDADVAAIEADIYKLYEGAASKPTNGIPFVICIDANVPYRIHEQTPLLGIEGLAESIARSPRVSERRPASEFMLCVTTCGWYYALHSPAFPVKKTFSFPLWTTAVPRNFNTFVAVLQAMGSTYTSPQSGDVKIEVDPSREAALAFPGKGRTAPTEVPPPAALSE